MQVVWFAFPVSICLSIICAMLLLEHAPSLGLIDNPGGRKAHSRVTPLIGGLIIFAGLWALPVTSHDLLGAMQILVLGLLTVIIGVLDDRHELSARVRFMVHLVAGLGMSLWAGVALTHVGDLVGTGVLALGILSIPVSCFAVAAAMNAYNMIDGVDGLAGALATLPVAVVLVLGLQAEHEPLIGLSLALLGGLGVFLLLNFPFPWRDHAACFLGDTGSTLLGLMVAWLLIASAQAGLMRPVFALYLLAIPLADTAGVMLRRILRGVSLVTPGRDHLHHIFIDAGMSPRHATYLIVALALLVASVGLVCELRGVPEWVLFVLFLIFIIANMLLLRSVERAKTTLRRLWFER